MARKKKSDIIDVAQTSDIWKVLTAEQQEYISKNSKVINVKKNEIIYAEGETPNCLLCVISGHVKIYKEGIGGRSQIVRLVMPKEFFGYRAFFAGEKYVTSASALEPCVIYAIEHEILLSTLKQNPELSLAFIRFLSIDLGISDTRSVVLTQKHVRGRLAESLIYLKDTYGTEEDGNTLVIQLSREDLASYSNMTTSNAIRTLSIFVSDKLVEVDGRKIKILEEDKLRRIARFE